MLLKASSVLNEHSSWPVGDSLRVKRVVSQARINADDEARDSYSLSWNNLNSAVLRLHVNELKRNVDERQRARDSNSVVERELIAFNVQDRSVMNLKVAKRPELH